MLRYEGQMGQRLGHFQAIIWKKQYLGKINQRTSKLSKNNELTQKMTNFIKICIINNSFLLQKKNKKLIFF